MILSYHPCFEADKNILCAGREPSADDLTAIKSRPCRNPASGMLSIPCTKWRITTAGMYFLILTARFQYPGKIGQVRLFQEKNVPHPRTETYMNLDTPLPNTMGGGSETPAFDFPFVFKFDWGGGRVPGLSYTIHLGI